MKNFYILFMGLLFMGHSYANNATSHEEITIYQYKDGISLEITVSTFVPQEHTIKKCTDGRICLIDNQPFFGTDGVLPKKQLVKLVFQKDNLVIPLETSGMYNPAVYPSQGIVKPAIEDKSIKIIQYYQDTWIITGHFSDGAGGYDAAWLVIENGSIRIVLGDSEILPEALSGLFK